MRLGRVLEGWDGYQTSLLHAVEPLTIEQLAWRPGAERRSVGEVVRHIALGRVTWLARMPAPGIEGIAARIPQWHTDSDGSRHPVEESVACDSASELAEWLARSWQPIQRMLDEWTVDDLFRTYAHRFRGTDYAISYQWTLWRVMSHDIHHGGQLATLLGLQGIRAFELGPLGGHIIVPPPARPATIPQ